MEKSLVIAAILLLSGCANSGLSQLGVSDGENAVVCIRAYYSGRFTDSRGDYSMIEFPAQIETSTLTPELIRSLTELANSLCPR